MKQHTIRAFVSKMPVVLALSSLAMISHAAPPVKAPPLPPGSDKVRVEAGLSPEEITRQQHAHKHSAVEKKDPTRDDSQNAEQGVKDLKDPNPSPN